MINELCSAKDSKRGVYNGRMEEKRYQKLGKPGGGGLC